MVSSEEVAFTIRDDDICYFTKPWMLDILYEEAWRLGFKVSLTVIPYVKPTNLRLVPPRFRRSETFFPISENHELVEYLLKKIDEKRIEIVQHGYSHTWEEGKPEFAVNDFELVNERMKRGNDLLRETFKWKINVFVAPYERISKATWKSIYLNGMCLSQRFGLRSFLTTVPLGNIDFLKLFQ